MAIDQELVSQITDLLSEARLSQESLKLERCALSGNNRTFRVQTSDGVFAAKQYFKPRPGDWDRLNVEFRFLSYAQLAAPKRVPKPYAYSQKNQIALYEFIEGRPLIEKEITEKEVNAAIDFFGRLNDPVHRLHADHLPNAAEACFSIQDHLNLIGSRIKQLEHIAPDTEESQAARQCAQKLRCFWGNLLEKTIEDAHRHSLDLETPLPPEQRCISPSDFGFHNALRTADDQLCFLDFEYAGWDDPAKMIGDFFAQIAVPVPEQFFDLFIHKTLGIFPSSGQLIRRAKILHAAYRVKWCCIALNIFFPYHLEKRKFANDGLDVRFLQCRQLSKAEKLLHSLQLLEL